MLLMFVLSCAEPFRQLIDAGLCKIVEIKTHKILAFRLVYPSQLESTMHSAIKKWIAAKILNPLAMEQEIYICSECGDPCELTKDVVGDTNVRCNK